MPTFIVRAVVTATVVETWEVEAGSEDQAQEIVLGDLDPPGNLWLAGQEVTGGEQDREITEITRREA